MRKLIAGAIAALALAGGSAFAASATPGPNGTNNKGLCTAYFNGSERGQEQKHKAGPFVALEEAAEENDQTVAEFCDGLVGGRPDDKPTPGGDNAGPKKA